MEVEICGIKVHFPFQPYEVQVEYMKSVLTCLNERRHGVLESPTGTGKTLSLLCSSLSWLHNEKIRRRNDANASCHQAGAEAVEDGGWSSASPKIIYASRTHSQLKQVIDQFKKTAYRHIFHATVMGSRDQMCVNMSVQKESTLASKNVLCNVLVKKRSCRFYNNVKNSAGAANFDPIEETERALENMRLSKMDTTSCCPFYAGRELVPRSDIIFMPYNYLIDLHTQKSFKFNLAGCVIIVDEGHNIPKVCEEAASVSITNVDIACCLSNVTEEMQNYYEDAMGGAEEKEYSSEDLVVIHQALTKLEETVDTAVPKGQTGLVHAGSHVFKLFASSGITSENYRDISGMLQKVGDNILSKAGTSTGIKGLPLKRLGDNIMLIFNSAEDIGGLAAIDKSFKVYLEEDFSSKRDDRRKVVKRMSYWCFNPSFTLKQLLQHDVRSIILTSGTLSPIEATVKELSLINPVTLENNHIINPKQILITTIGRGPTNTELKCTYSNRENISYWRELGITIENLSRQIPDGLLVFFPSYIALAKAREVWGEIGLLRRLGSIKTVLYEPSDKSEMPSVMSEYASEIEEGKGAFLFAVCRGKISEGLDFSGKFARGVIITGIPFAPVFDPKVKLKKEFININRDLFQGLTGDSWYQMDAMRAVNQAMGRVIRHIDDYGAIILCDSRFATSANSSLPKWLKSKHITSPSFGRAVISVRKFFIDAKRYIDLRVSSRCCQETHLPQVNNATPIHETDSRFKVTLNEETHRNNECLTNLVKRAEQVFNVNFLVNPTVLETEINSKTHINVQPAKRRKIKITHANNFPEPSGSQISIDLTKFLLDVKLALEPDSYASFAFIIKKYKLTNDYEETVSLIEKLFMGGEIKFPKMLNDCQILFTGDHLKNFKKYLETKH